MFNAPQPSSPSELPSWFKWVALIIGVVWTGFEIKNGNWFLGSLGVFLVGLAAAS